MQLPVPTFHAEGFVAHVDDESISCRASALGCRAPSERLLTRKAERLNADDPDYLARMRLEMSFVDQMRRIYTLSKRIAKDVLPAAIARRD
jgi:hypothetical protein